MRNLNNKNILVTGATGLIGCRLVEMLLEIEGTHVIVVGRTASKLKATFCSYIEKGRVEILAHDMQYPFPTITMPIHFIFHAAGFVGDVIRERPIDVINPNIYGIKHCLDFLKDQKEKKSIDGRIIVISSVTIYHNTTSNDIHVSECDSSGAEALESINAPYSGSKRMCEIIARAYQRQYDMDVVIARLSTVYGYAKNMSVMAYFEFIRNCFNNEDIVFKSSGFYRRDNIYVDDVATGLITIAEKGLTGEAYNVSANGEGDSFVALDEVAHVIVDTSNSVLGDRTLKVVEKDANAARKPGVMLNNDKLKALGWKASTNFKEGMRKTILKYKTNGL